MTTSKFNLSSILSNAWSFFKANLFPTFSECMKAAWKRAKLVRQMREGIARFIFVKKSDGSTRNAIGTLRNGNFSYESKGSTKKKNPANVSYFDIEKNAFRSFSIVNLISI
jgi:hypothetical protein